ncbi:MAG: hypothetical protein ACERKD_13175 [Prolixibacteraceae bacterium]
MTAWNIKKVKIADLDYFFQEYTLHSSSVLPISPLRIQSYIRNLRAKLDDVALYYIEDQNQIIAFRTVWADEVQVGTESVRFAWCSGNWVSPEYRRQGISSLILDEMFADWNGKLMFTNYAPESLAGYLKSGLFHLQRSRNGSRFYFNANLLELYATRMRNKGIQLVIWMANLLFRAWYHVRKYTFAAHRFPVNSIDVKQESDDYAVFLAKDSMFKRGPKELSWILEFPWLEKDANKIKIYPFSWKVKDFGYYFIKIETKKVIVSCMISVREGELKLLYWNAADEHHELIAKWLVNFSSKNKIKMLTVLDPSMAKKIKEIRNPFVWNRSYSMNIYSTFDVPENKLKVYDGDGDYIFT